MNPDHRNPRFILQRPGDLWRHSGAQSQRCGGKATEFEKAASGHSLTTHGLIKVSSLFITRIFSPFCTTLRQGIRRFCGSVDVPPARQIIGLRASAETSPIHFAPAYIARNNVKKRIGLTIRNNVKCVGIAYSGIFIPIIGFSAKGPWRGRTAELVPG